MKSIKKFHHSSALRLGMRDGAPIGLGYFAVAFSLGIAAKNAGLSAMQACLASILCNASAGEYAGFTVIAANASYIEMAFITAVANARYILMSCAMSQRISPGTGSHHRLLMSFDITDELFGIAMARPGSLDPYYTYGAMTVSIPMWAAGTAIGAAAGSILPHSLVSALSVALYGMFLAVIIPPARRDRIILALVVVSFALSLAASMLPYVRDVSEGTRTVILTVIISAAAALLFPRKDEEPKEDEP